MSVQHISTEWPRAGGVYQDNTYPDLRARVTAVIDGEVHATYIHRAGNEGGSLPRVSESVFRKRHHPEDQSPIPALVKALKAFLDDYDNAGLFSETELQEHAKQARSALALAGETGGESEAGDAK